MNILPRIQRKERKRWFGCLGKVLHKMESIRKVRKEIEEFFPKIEKEIKEIGDETLRKEASGPSQIPS